MKGAAGEGAHHMIEPGVYIQFLPCCAILCFALLNGICTVQTVLLVADVASGCKCVISELCSSRSPSR